jgi:hypothetical protein
MKPSKNPFFYLFPPSKRKMGTGKPLVFPVLPFFISCGFREQVGTGGNKGTGYVV